MGVSLSFPKKVRKIFYLN